MSATLYKVCRRLPSGTPVDIPAAMGEQWLQLKLAELVRNKQIAIGVGSRGVAEIPAITRCLVELIRAAGGEPFVTPAMGSHGGATAEGELEVLHSLGITEAAVGCPLRATTDTVILGQTESGLDVHLDRLAAEAGGVFIINRVKIHTDYHGRYESGLMKMLAIGLGNPAGAFQIHSYGVHGLRDLVPEVAQSVLQLGNVIAGIATIEDGYHRPVELVIVPRDDISDREPQLLEDSRALVPRLPVDDIDVLIVEKIGKDISGTGMDTNVIGRIWIGGEPDPETPRIKALVALDLSEASHGNATGVGLADFTTRHLLDKIDFEITARNIRTSGFMRRGYIPLVLATEDEAIEAALDHVFRSNPQARSNARIVRIHNTLELEELWVSASLLEEVQVSPGFISL